jgi:hypothetical protein
MLEGIRWSIDCIFWSFQQLTVAAVGVSKDNQEAFDLPIFTNCWSIVDQCHMLRKLLEELPHAESNPLTDFVSKFESATLIRNRMDHLHSQLGNLANTKEQRPPILGVLSYCRLEESDLAVGQDGTLRPVGCEIVTLAAGNLAMTNHSFEAVNPAGKIITAPVGLFQFEAFDQKLDISELRSGLDDVVKFFDTKVRKNVEDSIREQANEHGLDPETLIAERIAGGLRVFLHIRFDIPTEGNGFPIETTTS